MELCPALRVGSRDQERRTMQCACCGTPIDRKSAWKVADQRFYCSEFCADSETADRRPRIVAPASATLLDLHRNRPYERLERLLPYMRRYSQRALAARASA